MTDKKSDTPNLPALPVNTILEDSGIDMASLDVEGLMAINELYMSLTQKPDNYHGDDIQWQMANLRLVQGLTTRDGVDVPQTAKSGDIVAAGETLFDSDNGKGSGFKCVCVHMCKTYTYYPPEGSDDRIRTVFEQTYNEAIPEIEKIYDNSPGGLRTRWRVGYDYVLIPLDMSAIYKVRFVKSSGKAGRSLQRKVSSWKSLAQFPIGIYSREESIDKGSQKITYSVFDFTLDAATEVPPAVQALAHIIGKAYNDHYLQLKEEDMQYEVATRATAAKAAGDLMDVGGDDGGSGFDDDM